MVYQKHLYLLILIFFLNFKVAFCQTNVDLARANAYVEIGEYANAVRYFEYAYFGKNDPNHLSSIAFCYLKINQLKKAEKYFRKLEIKNQLTENDYVAYIKLLNREQKFEKAQEVCNSFQKQFSTNMFVQEINIMTDSLLKWQNQESNFIIENVSKINTEFSEISPFKLNNTLYLASNKEEIVIQKKSSSNLLPYYNLFFCDLDSMGLPQSKLKSFATVFNSNEHECALSFSDNGQHVFFANSIDHRTSKGQIINQSKLFMAEIQDKKWEQPQAFVFNDSSYSYTHPSLDPDYKMLFFVSDMKGGFGGTDIYVCINVEGKWTNPINLGNKINTIGNEIYPFYQQDGTLFFSSDTHSGFGGYDIFMAKELDGEWGNVTNLKLPINSTSDDFGIYIDNKMKKGYFSSNRKGGKGAEDIYMFYPKSLKPNFNIW